jgi:glycopeptide antibiotics resistance protein
MKNFKRVISLGLVLYLLLLVRLIIFKFPASMTAEILQRWSINGALRNMSNVNIIPFTTIWDDLFNATLPVQLPTLIYNMVAFVPLGFLIPLISKRGQRLVIVLIVAFSISTSLELIQIFTLLGTGDIDDVILNMIGAAIGYGVFALVVWWKQYFARFMERHH